MTRGLEITYSTNPNPIRLNAILEQGPAAVFFALIIAHALADYPLQSAYMAQHKDRHAAGSASEWLIALLAHSTIHAGGVWLVTGNLYLGLVEFVLHILIDTGKSKKLYNLVVDQLLHVACNIGYVVTLCIIGPL